MQKLIGFTLFLALFAVCGNSYASTLYTDLTSFLNNSSTPTVIDFEENAAGGFTNHGTGPAIFSGVNFTGSSVYTVDPDFSPGFYEWGTGDVMIDAFGVGTILATLPGGYTAVGSDIMSFEPEAANFDITLSTGEIFNVSTALRPNQTFVGFISDVPLTSLSFAVKSGNNPVIDNFRFGSALDHNGGTAVPEPATIFLTGMGLLSLIGSRFRRSSV